MHTYKNVEALQSRALQVNRGSQFLSSSSPLPCRPLSFPDDRSKPILTEETVYIVLAAIIALRWVL